MRARAFHTNDSVLCPDGRKGTVQGYVKYAQDTLVIIAFPLRNVPGRAWELHEYKEEELEPWTSK